MDIKGFDRAQREYDQREPDDMPEPERAYREGSTRQEQTVICKEFMAHTEGWGLYDDWLASKGIAPDDVELRLYCEGLQSFWEFVSHE